MLAVPADRLPAALADLDPGNRALLDLSLRRGVSDVEIGELLRKDPADVARGREAVLELLADALDVGGHDRRDRVRQAVTALPDEAWRTRSAAAPTAPAAPAPPPRRPAPAPPPAAEGRAPEPKPERQPPRDFDDRPRFAPDPDRSRRGRLLAALGLLAVLGVVVALLASGGGDDDDSNESGSQPAPTQPGQGPAPAGGDEVRLAALGDGPGRGTVTVTDDGATITVRGLPDPAPGSYQVWLYSSVVQAKALGTIDGGSGEVKVQLPPDADRYRFLDVSREPPNGNPNHSGESVMRAPL